jgi:hypothetical protein
MQQQVHRTLAQTARQRRPSRSPLPAAAGLGGTQNLIGQGVQGRFGIKKTAP